jgi:hypothetical protein
LPGPAPWVPVSDRQWINPRVDGSIPSLFHLLEGNYRALGIVKYAVIGSIFVASRFLPRPTADHRWLAAAVACLFVEDFFLILRGAYWRRVRGSRAELLLLLPVVGALLPVT